MAGQHVLCHEEHDALVAISGTDAGTEQEEAENKAEDYQAEAGDEDGSAGRISRLVHVGLILKAVYLAP